MLSGCKPSETAPEELRLGVIIPQSGPLAEVGDFLYSGIELALEEINADGGIDGKPLKIILEDDQCVPKNAVSSLTKLIEVDNIKAVVGPFCSGPTLAAAPIANERKVVLLSPGATSQDTTDAGDYIFRVSPSDAVEGPFLGRAIAEKYDKIAILYVKNRWATDAVTAIQDAFTGTITTLESFETEAKSVQTQLVKIQETEPEALLVLVYPQHYGIVTKQAIELGFDMPFFAAKTFETPAGLALGKDAERYTYSTVDYAEGFAEGEAYKETYRKKHGKEASIWSALAYDATMILANALASCGEESECIKNYLYELQGHRGASGIKSFDENGDIKDPYLSMKTVKDGKFVKSPEYS